MENQENQSSVDSLIDKIVSGDNTEAQSDFNSLIAAKVQDALDIRKAEIAQAVYSSQDTENTSEDEPSESNEPEEEPEQEPQDA